MSMTKTETSPSDTSYYANHTTEALRKIVDRYSADSAAMMTSSPALSADAMSIANAAWFELFNRGEL